MLPEKGEDSVRTTIVLKEPKGNVETCAKPVKQIGKHGQSPGNKAVRPVQINKPNSSEPRKAKKQIRLDLCEHSKLCLQVFATTITWVSQACIDRIELIRTELHKVYTMKWKETFEVFRQNWKVPSKAFKTNWRQWKSVSLLIRFANIDEIYDNDDEDGSKRTDFNNKYCKSKL